MSEWISVKDRLPPPGDDVLVYWHRRCLVCYMASTKNGSFTWYDIGEQSWINEPEAVTHWSPLPAQPKETRPDCRHYGLRLDAYRCKQEACGRTATKSCQYGAGWCEYEPCQQAAAGQPIEDKMASVNAFCLMLARRIDYLEARFNHHQHEPKWEAK